MHNSGVFDHRAKPGTKRFGDNRNAAYRIAKANQPGIAKLHRNVDPLRGLFHANCTHSNEAQTAGHNRGIFQVL